ncbi:MAG TPA: GNAT family N-acetyltransferase [Planctomycetota bacterium]|nr:GNAT family N-acetyltransferase [Planctomycetota bacterium]
MDPLSIALEDPRRVSLDDLLVQDEATIAHEPSVLVAVARAYRLRTLVALARRGPRVVGALPLVLVRGPLGAVLASTAYFDSGGPLGEPEVREALVSRAAWEAISRGAVLELRSPRPLAPVIGLASSVAGDKATLVRELPSDENEIVSDLDPKTRNQLRKTLREGLSSETVPADGAALAAFHAVYARTLRDLGSPPHSLRFFREVARALPSRAHVARVSDASGRLLAAALVLDDRRGGCVLPWAASDRRADALEPNTLLYYELLAGAIRRGKRRFDFGRSTLGSPQHRFKERWGALPLPLHWTVVARRSTPPVTRDARLERARALWRKIPVGLSALAGSLLLRWLAA